jgi:hypothetical protein
MYQCNPITRAKRVPSVRHETVHYAADKATFFMGGVGESRLEDEFSVSTFRFVPNNFEGDGEPNFMGSSGSAML